MVNATSIPRRVVLAAAVLAVAAGCGSEPARVEDQQAGLAFELPPRWEELASYDRRDRYSATADAGVIGPSVSTFSQSLTEGRTLGAFAEELAEGEMLYVSPELDEFELLRSESAAVDGRDAHDVEMTAVDPTHGPVYARVVVVALDDDTAGVLFGFSGNGGDDDERAEIGDAAESLALL